MSRNAIRDKAKIVERLNKMPIVEVACKQIGLPRPTYYRWRREDEEFAKACDEAIEQSADRINDLAESQLINAIKAQSMPAITFWLKHHHPVYENRLKLNGELTLNQPALTPEQAALVERALTLGNLIIEEGESNE